MVVGLSMLLLVAAMSQAGGETFTATASVKAPAGTATRAITIHVDRLVTEAERATILAAVSKNDPAAVQKALEATPDVGYIEADGRRTPLKYAYGRSTGGGRLLTVVTAKPVGYIGASDPGAKAAAGHEIALALLVLDDKSAGNGEISPAVTLKVDAQGAIVTSDYSHEVVRLTQIAKVK